MALLDRLFSFPCGQKKTGGEKEKSLGQVLIQVGSKDDTTKLNSFSEAVRAPRLRSALPGWYTAGD